MRFFLMTSAFTAAFFTAPAASASESFEFWLNPSIGTDLDEDTAVEVETAQRFRSEKDGKVDTYFARLWVKQAISDDFTFAGAIERRENDGGSNELRTIQQLSGRHGIVRSRLRLEQRFVDGRGGHMGLRLRPRLGLSVPLDRDGKWAAGADAELFWTLRATSVGGDTGVTGLRNTAGVSYEIDDNLSVSIDYLRQQNFEADAPDEVAHAPLIGLEFTF